MDTEVTESFHLNSTLKKCLLLLFMNQFISKSEFVIGEVNEYQISNSMKNKEYCFLNFNIRCTAK